MEHTAQVLSVNAIKRLLVQCAWLGPTIKLYTVRKRLLCGSSKSFVLVFTKSRLLVMVSILALLCFTYLLILCYYAFLRPTYLWPRTLNWGSWTLGSILTEVSPWSQAYLQVVELAYKTLQIWIHEEESVNKYQKHTWGQTWCSQSSQSPQCTPEVGGSWDKRVWGLSLVVHW